MLKTIRLNRQRTITLPSATFRPADSVAMITEGNTVIIKKLAVARFSDIPVQKAGPVPSLGEIVRDIHAYRRQKAK
jgi:hypothetical protein